MLKWVLGVTAFSACSIAIVGVGTWLQRAAPVSNRAAVRPPEMPRTVEVCHAAQAAVRQKLASKSSARFPACGDVSGVTQEGSVYVVASSFETPDKSGVYITRTYRVLVLDEGDRFRTSDPIIR